MTIASVVLEGYGNGTVVGTIPLVSTSGYTIGDPLIAADVVCNLLALIGTRQVSLSATINTGVSNLSASIETVSTILGLISTREISLNSPIDTDPTNIEATIEC